MRPGQSSPAAGLVTVDLIGIEFICLGRDGQCHILMMSPNLVVQLCSPSNKGNQD